MQALSPLSLLTSLRIAWDSQAQVLLRQGTWLLSLDEKTSIQAREGEQPPRPACPSQPVLHAARYHRRGARHLFAGLSIADGKVYGTSRSRKCFVDFQAFVQQEIIPEALRRHVHTVIFILDNATTHAPKQLERWLLQQYSETALSRQLQVSMISAAGAALFQLWHDLELGADPLLFVGSKYGAHRQHQSYFLSKIIERRQEDEFNVLLSWERLTPPPYASGIADSPIAGPLRRADYQRQASISDRNTVSAPGAGWMRYDFVEGWSALSVILPGR